MKLVRHLIGRLLKQQEPVRWSGRLVDRSSNSAVITEEWLLANGWGIANNRYYLKACEEYDWVTGGLSLTLVKQGVIWHVHINIATVIAVVVTQGQLFRLLDALEGKEC